MINRENAKCRKHERVVTERPPTPSIEHANRCWNEILGWHQWLPVSFGFQNRRNLKQSRKGAEDEEENLVDGLECWRDQQLRRRCK
jgi:hypothetical protein